MRIGLPLLAAALLPSLVGAQGRPEIRVERADGSFEGVPLELGGGYASVPLQLMEALGWTTERAGGVVRLRIPNEITVTLREGSPFFRWDDVVLQLADAPYREGGETYLPLQLLTDFFPRRLPDLYDFDGPNATLRAGDPRLGDRASVASEPPAARERGEIQRPDGRTASGRTTGAGDSARSGGSAERANREVDPSYIPPPSDVPSAYEGVRVVVIDAGHGGADPGALGPGDIREKTVALGIALELERLLDGREGLEIHMIRDDDSFVEIWDRGEIATEVKGDRPGIFVSIHANSFPQRRAATGFETYFLSEARTEHERRVAANENAAIGFQGQGVDAEEQPDLDFILRELRNVDHQHWSGAAGRVGARRAGRLPPRSQSGCEAGCAGGIDERVHAVRPCRGRVPLQRGRGSPPG